jgi:hypothetical protein
MALQGSGAISMANINTELGRSSTATIGLNEAEAGSYGAIKLASNSRPNGSTPNSMSEWYGYNHAIPTPEYWWRADSGLSTSAWNAYVGGLNFTLYNVTSASSSTGVYFNGTTGYGLTGNAGSNIDARHVFVRTDSLDGTAGRTILGGSQHNIHEWYYTNVANDWYIVERLFAALTYAASGGQAGTTATWTDLVNGTAPRYYKNSDTTYGSHTVYAGTYNNRLRWESGYGLYVGRRHEGNYGQFYCKEIAIFTTSLSAADATLFRDSMMSRWP